MISEFDMSKLNIPYGVLHDSRLREVRYGDGSMVFSFDVDISPEDWDSEYYEKYAGFKHCDMIVMLEDDPWNYFYLQTAMDDRGRFRGLSLGLEEYLNAINLVSSAEFLECTAGYREFRIELAVNFWGSKKSFRKYRKYGLCYVTLDAKSITWNWY